MRASSHTLAFRLYIAATLLGGSGAVVVAAIAAPATLAHAAGASGLWVLWALVVGTELLPIRVARPHSVDSITISSGFALAVLLLYGPAPALVVWSSAAAVADLAHRLPVYKALFNAAQYALSAGAGALVLVVAGAHPPIAPQVSELPAVTMAAASIFVANHVLVGLSLGLISGTTALAHLRSDFGFHLWTGAFQFALAPLLVAAAGPLSALGLFPVLAIYLGGRHAAAAQHRATHDLLTNLPNRSVLCTVLEHWLCQATPRQPVWLLILDLDDFKSVNDALGDQVGDQLLSAVARRLAGVLRQPDLLVRLGADEFAVVVHDADQQAATVLARRLLDALSQPVEVGDGLLLSTRGRVGLSGSRGGDEAEELLRRADSALHEAKDSAWPLAICAGQRRPHRAVDRLALARALHDGLEANQVHVNFQLKVPVSGGSPIGVEALARWRHPTLGVVDPAGFIAVAEQTGMIRRLTLQVLDSAFGQYRAWWLRQPSFRLAVNLSPRSLGDHSLADAIAGLLSQHSLPGHALQLEITESACLTGIPSASAVIHELKALGVTLAIDDFGTGFSSLAQLQRLRVEEIKIDRSFVQAMHQSHQAAAIVRSTVGLARSLDLSVTAEGVETDDALETLRGYGCDYAQGFLFGHPAPGPSIEPLLGIIPAGLPDQPVQLDAQPPATLPIGGEIAPPEVLRFGGPQKAARFGGREKAASSGVAVVDAGIDSTQLHAGRAPHRRPRG